MRDKTPIIKPSKPSKDSRPKKKLSSPNPSCETKFVTGSLNKSNRKSNTKIVVPKGRKMSNPVKKALRNFRENDVILVDTSLSLTFNRLRSEKKIRPKTIFIHNRHCICLFPPHDFSICLILIIKSNQMQPAMN